MQPVQSARKHGIKAKAQLNLDCSPAIEFKKKVLSYHFRINVQYPTAAGVM